MSNNIEITLPMTVKIEIDMSQTDIGRIRELLSTMPDYFNGVAENMIISAFLEFNKTAREKLEKGELCVCDHISGWEITDAPKVQEVSSEIR